MTALSLSGEQRRTIAEQIGRMTILSISGGRIRPIEGGIELPVGSGYSVRVELAPSDTYTVSRVFRRGGKEWIKGSRSEVYCSEVGEVAYFAGMFRSYGEEEWIGKVAS